MFYSEFPANAEHHLISVKFQGSQHQQVAREGYSWAEVREFRKGEIGSDRTGVRNCVARGRINARSLSLNSGAQFGQIDRRFDDHGRFELSVLSILELEARARTGVRDLQRYCINGTSGQPERREH